MRFSYLTLNLEERLQNQKTAKYCEDLVITEKNSSGILIIKNSSFLWISSESKKTNCKNLLYVEPALW